MNVDIIPLQYKPHTHTKQSWTLPHCAQVPISSVL